LTESAASPLIGTAKLPKPMVPTKAANQPMKAEDESDDIAVEIVALLHTALFLLGASDKREA
jgi:hypothetical protein